MSVSRRNFLMGGLTIFGATLSATDFFSLASQAAELKGRKKGAGPVLVVIQLSGGNDGINTVVPYADDNYKKLRPQIAVKAEDVLKLNDKVGLNPVMTDMSDLFKQGKLAVVQAVGYPEPNRSHFRSIEIWQTAEPKKIKDTGWVGRYLDLASVGKKNGDLLFPAINVDPILPKTLSASKIVVPSIANLDNFSFKADPKFQNDRQQQVQSFMEMYSDFSLKRPYVEQLRAVGLDTTRASEDLAKLAKGYDTKAPYGKDNFSQRMKFIAQLISSGVDCPIYAVSMGGFDTHTNQPNSQPNLLRQLSQGVSAFITDLGQQGCDQDVVVMTFSEFGRRVAENGSRGTDHGTALPVFIAGTNVKGGVFGDTPSLTDLQDGDIKYKIDFRNVYASVLDQWLRADSKEILGTQFDTLPLFQRA